MPEEVYLVDDAVKSDESSPLYRSSLEFPGTLDFYS